MHASFVRSPYSHAKILKINISEALKLDGVEAVLTGEDVIKWSEPFVVGVKQPMEHWCLGVKKVRYVGEPVAIVIARNRYIAEDATELVNVEYDLLPPVMNIESSIKSNAPILHEKVKSNIVSERNFNYGNVEKAFSLANNIVEIDVEYPRNSCTPIECFNVISEYSDENKSYNVLSNFQGPMALHPVMAMALKIPGNKLRLRAPQNSGGSFGVKQAVFYYIVSISLASKKVGRPVKWVEDRLEHLIAATSATGRKSKISAAITKDGLLLGLKIIQYDDCGAYLRAPEPASLYRMHGNLSGAYSVKNISLKNYVVLTNKTPSGLNRGFGGPQLYFGLERLMHKISKVLNKPHLQIIKTNLLPQNSFPYKTPSGGILDSGNYQKAIQKAEKDGGLEELEKRRRGKRKVGKLYGIGFAAVVEPSISNMGYISTVLSHEERLKAGPKNGAYACATVSIDPLGSISVTIDSLPQGQGHQTVVQQLVASVFSIDPKNITVSSDLDTHKDGWSIAAGNYSSRFGGAVAGTVYLAAQKLFLKLKTIAAKNMNINVEDVIFQNDLVFSKNNPDNKITFSRLAGSSHWSPDTIPDAMAPPLRETLYWTMPQHKAPNEKDEINSSGSYGFIFDYCGVEIDQNTGKVIIDKYVTTHDAGTLLHPEIVNGQIQGAFAQAVGASLYEEFKYADNGEFLSGTFADYLVPTVNEIPEACILHISTPSPFTPLGSKGVGEGNSMSTPVCIANAISDAIEQDKITLPMTPPKLWGLISKKEDLPKNLNLEITDEKKKISVELYQNYTNKKFWKYIKNKLRNIV
ncbi:MAG: Caffeine dehydrogenase subunit alpha [Alphaproteobacteria bacterium MarineAlpha9_Bin2]|nr:MAG: Caffeine dehydrogenase subunit alpha [Alphaproteobacteria bacterium MarineAlpha9_Bin2]